VFTPFLAGHLPTLAGISDKQTQPKRCWVPSERNSFGLVRCYYVEEDFPDHDPDATDVSIGPISHLPPAFPSMGPFRNLSSFELAEWYWTTGGSLSLVNFTQLVSLLTKQDFSIADIGSTNWRQAFQVLAENKDALSAEDGDWINDDGWRVTDISVAVPFHSRTKNPGVHSYTAGKLRHRCIVSIIRETLSNPKRSRGFHFQPYRLVWKRHPSAPEINLQGELYTSEAFLQAHQELQHCDPEPGCTLE
jgi:hypothetical protein